MTIHITHFQYEGPDALEQNQRCGGCLMKR